MAINKLNEGLGEMFDDFRNDVVENTYVTNSFINETEENLKKHKTTEENAHDAKQIKYKMITVDKELVYSAGRISNLVLGHNGDGINEVKDSRADNYGKAHPTLHDRLKADFERYQVDKNEILTKTEAARKEILDIEYRFQPETQEMQFITDLSPYTNAVMQSFWIDPKTHIIYMTQAWANNSYRLSRLKPNGQFIDRLLVKGGGHGTHNGYRYIGNQLWIYSHMLDSNGKSKIVRFKYKTGEIAYGQGTEDVYTGYSDSRYITPIINQKEGLIIYRVQPPNDEAKSLGILNYVEVRKLSDVDNNVNNVLYRVNIPMSLTSGTQPMQGITYDNGILYWYTGDSNPINKNYLTAFDIKTSNQLWRRTVEVGGVNGRYTGDFQEAEGISMYYDEETGKKALLVGVTTGPGNNRHHEIYSIGQRDLNDMLKSRAFPVLMTDSGGRVKPMPLKGVLKLTDVREVGHYYIYTTDTQTISDFPMSKAWRNAGWFLDVLPGSFNGAMRQILTRSSTGRNMVKFERIINALDGTAGPWNFVKMSAGFWERVPDSINTLSSLNIVGMEYYITTDDSKRFSDFPKGYKGVAGWILEIKQIANGAITQILRRNNYDYHHQYFVRNIGSETSKWSLFEGKEVD